MTFAQYSMEASDFARYPSEPSVNGVPIYPFLGLAGETGEVMEKLKKALREHGALNEEAKVQIARELGDALWYLNECCLELGYTLNDVASDNLNKLSSRIMRGKLFGQGDNR